MNQNNQKSLPTVTLVLLICYAIFASIGTTILNISSYLDQPFLGDNGITLAILFIVFFLMNIAIYFFIPWFLNYLFGKEQ